MAWWGFENKWRRFHGNLLARLSAKMVSAKFRAAFTQKTGNFGTINTYLATLIVPRKLGLTMAVLNPDK